MALAQPQTSQGFGADALGVLASLYSQLCEHSPQEQSLQKPTEGESPEEVLSLIGTKHLDVEPRFNRLKTEWKANRPPTSFARDLVMLPSYLSIIGMGKDALPFILRELDKELDHWFIALRAISDEDPVPVESRGKMAEMREAWLRWDVSKVMSGSWNPKDFPNLAPSDFEITSPKTTEYNCVGWAAGKLEWWEPDQYNTYYWPPTIPREYTMPAYIAAYRSIGYQPCGTPHFEEGHEKVALYADDDGNPTHAARQLQCGQWTSKLGDFEDIEHLTLTCLNGPYYGEPVFYLVRSLKSG